MHNSSGIPARNAMLRGAEEGAKEWAAVPIGDAEGPQEPRTAHSAWSGGAAWRSGPQAAQLCSLVLDLGPFGF